MDEPKLSVYGAPWCPDCKRSKQFLGEQRVPYRWIDIGIFLTIRDAPAGGPLPGPGAAGLVRDLVEEANAVLAQCKMHLELEAAQVVSLPERLLRI